jgi:hypothetical protein
VTISHHALGGREHCLKDQVALIEKPALPLDKWQELFRPHGADCHEHITTLNAQALRAELCQPTVEAHRELEIPEEALFAQDETDVVEGNLRVEAGQRRE